MTRSPKSRVLTVLWALAMLGMSSSSYADELVFGLLPSNGQVSGPAGSVIGWGYSLTNQSATNWSVTTGLNSDSFAFGVPLTLFDFPVIAPGGSITVPFNSALGSGLYQFTWDTLAPMDYANFGEFVLSSEWWSGDPFDGGVFLSAATDKRQSYFGFVADASALPEADEWIIVCIALSASVSWFRRYQRRSKNNSELPN